MPFAAHQQSRCHPDSHLGTHILLPLDVAAGKKRSSLLLSTRLQWKSIIHSLTTCLWVYHKTPFRMNPPRGGAAGGRVMSATAAGASYAAVLTLSLDPSGSWDPANVRSQPLGSPCNPSTTMRGGRRQRGPLKLPALAATSREPHRRTSLARLRYVAHETKCQMIISTVWPVRFFVCLEYHTSLGVWAENFV